MEYIKLLASRRLLKEHSKVPSGFSTRSLYVGFDATAPSLHLGHIPSIISLVLGSSQGWNSIGLLGIATALIGDPSGRTEARPQLQSQKILDNSKCISLQISNLYSNLKERAKFHSFPMKEGELTVRENMSHFEHLNLVEFLREIGYYFPMKPLINRELVSSREESITYAEFSYCLMQAFDFYKLSAEFDCNIQVGGSDQWGNITTGTELIRKKRNTGALGITMPLLLNKDGTKFGKTTGNALFLDSQLTSSYEIYQYCYNIPDSEIEDLLFRLTFLSDEKIQVVSGLPLEDRERQKTLAEELITVVHSHEEFKTAQKLSEILFSKNYYEVFIT